MLQNAEQIVDRLKNIQLIQVTYDDAQELDEFRSELEEMETKLAHYSSKIAFLRDNSVPISSIKKTSQVLESLSNISKKFKEAPSRDTLVQGKRWSTLNSRIEQLIKELQENIKTSWQQYFDTHYFSGLSPEKRKITLAKTPKNTEALKSYTRLYEEFIKYRNVPPNEADEFHYIDKLSAQIGEIEFQDDVPADVKKFLDSVQFGASLDLLTPPVVIWLEQNKLMENYIVRAK